MTIRLRHRLPAPGQQVMRLQKERTKKTKICSLCPKLCSCLLLSLHRQERRLSYLLSRNHHLLKPRKTFHHPKWKMLRNPKSQKKVVRPSLLDDRPVRHPKPRLPFKNRSRLGVRANSPHQHSPCRDLSTPPQNLQTAHCLLLHRHPRDLPARLHAHREKHLLLRQRHPLPLAGHVRRARSPAHWKETNMRPSRRLSGRKARVVLEPVSAV